MDYLLKASGIVVLLFIFYYVFLKNETFFKSIRSYFLVGLVIVLAIPLLEIPVYVEVVRTQMDLADYNEFIATNIVQQASINWTQILTAIYLLGVVFFIGKFLVQLLSLGWLISKHSMTKSGAHYYIETNKNVSPFSFFNIIIFNKSQFSIEELEQIINHEKAHAIQWHSLDTLLAHLLVIVLWFNPFVWLYKKAVQQNLEFLADDYALNLANNEKLYQYTLLKTCNTTYCTEITNNFYNSLIKKRIVMIHKHRSENRSQWKYALLLPLLTAFVFAFNTKVIAQEKVIETKKSVETKELKEVKEVAETKELIEIREIAEEKELVETKELIEIKELREVRDLVATNEDVIAMVIDAKATKETLDKIKKNFKEKVGVTLTFKGIKRDDDGKLIAIKISASGDNSKAKFENSGSKPIAPIKISYNSESGNISITNLSKKSKGHYAYTVHDGGDHVKKIEIKGKPDGKGNYVFVSSDGEKKTWTTKKGDKAENIIIREIHSDKDGKGEHIEVKVIGEGKNKAKHWVHKGDKHDNVKVEVIEDEDGKSVITIVEKSDGSKHKIREHNVEIIKGDGENVFMVKSKDGKAKKHKIEKDGNVFYMSGDSEKALVVIDGKESTHEALKKLGPDAIESISILKNESAIKKYGEKAKDGVIEVTTKK